MGQKVNPIGFRLGIVKGWDSNWYGGNDYSEKLVEDERIRTYLKARLAKGSISKIVIERTLKLITVTINTARPGIIIGKGGKEVDKLKEELKKLLKRVNEPLASYESIKRVGVIKESFTVESGTLTPTLKIKRNVVTKQKEAFINKLYKSEDPVIYEI